MTRLIVILVLSAIVQGTAHAQVDDAPLRLKFSGGTVKEYIAALRQTYGESINIVSMPDAEAFLMPPVELADVISHSAINLLSEVAEPRPGINRGLRVENHGDLFTVRTFSKGSLEVPSVSHVLSVAMVLDAGFSAEDVLTVVEQVLALMGDAYDEPKLRFHEATGLLIAHGHPEQMSTMERAVRQLEAAAAQRGRLTRDERERLEIQAAAITDLQQQLNAEREQRLEMEQLAAVSAATIRALQEEIARAQRTIETLEHEYRTLQRRFDEVRNRPAPQPQ